MWAWDRKWQREQTAERCERMRRSCAADSAHPKELGFVRVWGSVCGYVTIFLHVLEIHGEIAKHFIN